MNSLITDEAFNKWNTFIPGPIDAVEEDWCKTSLYIKRLDLIRSWATGNKYYKLKYTIEEVLRSGIRSVVSKGGMFSNHLEALARACFAFDIECICLIRTYVGDENNPTINTLRSYGAKLFFLNPDEYQSFDIDQSKTIYPDSYFIPEGGADKNGLRGASEILAEINSHEFKYVVIAGGTMSTAAGILSEAPLNLTVNIVPAWKGCTREYVVDLICRYNLQVNCQWDLWPDHHFGGFGKYNTELVEFMYSFTERTGIPLDPVYTGKMMFAIREKMKAGYFPGDEKVLCIHTGGLQGIQGFAYRDPRMWSPYLELVDNTHFSITRG